jgi:hypothetical protein
MGFEISQEAKDYCDKADKRRAARVESLLKIGYEDRDRIACRAFKRSLCAHPSFRRRCINIVATIDTAHMVQLVRGHDAR